MGAYESSLSPALHVRAAMLGLRVAKAGARRMARVLGAQRTAQMRAAAAGAMAVSVEESVARAARIETLLASPSLARSELALELASLPDMIRGFGHVKEANVAKARQRQAELLASLTTDAGSRKAAE